MKYTYFFLIALLLACQSQKKSENPSLEFSRVTTDIPGLTGQLAYETTAYVEQFWRLAGNPGFDSSIYFVEKQLIAAGFVNEANAGKTDRMTYRIEKRPLDRPAWEPANGSLRFSGGEQILSFDSNRNMLAINSFSTEVSNVEVVNVENPAEIGSLDLKGKIIYAQGSPSRLFEGAIETGAIGILSYSNPNYLQPEKNVTSIQFRGMSFDEEAKLWAMPLSFEAKTKLEERLNQGATFVDAMVETRFHKSEELTIVADAKGSQLPDQRFVLSAHVQEPGANDNASGVGVATELAVYVADLVNRGAFDPARTITFLWGDEIVSTRRYIAEDTDRAEDIMWGMSLDMVGENTSLTGGSFLIEKMPDPSAIWTRGKDEHTEWGATEMTLDDMQPHYMNDLVLDIFSKIGAKENWQVKTNPFEGGSDHVPFLRADIPGVLLWHFTDQFYHTDNDRIDKVSRQTLKNVAQGSFEIVSRLANADDSTAFELMDLIVERAGERLEAEFLLSKEVIENGGDLEQELIILQAWTDWYIEALHSIWDISESGTVNAKMIVKDSNISYIGKTVTERLETIHVESN